LVHFVHKPGSFHYGRLNHWN